MTISDFQYFLLFVLTFAFVGFLTPVMRKVAITKKIYDAPTAAHKTHKEPVPYLGGVAIIIGVVFVSYGVAIVDGFTAKNYLSTRIFSTFFVSNSDGADKGIR